MLRLILGPAPENPGYARYWQLCLISVKADRERGLPVEWADKPPVPLPDDKPEETPAEPKKPRRTRKKAG